MKWTMKDVGTFTQEPEQMDTVIVPLIPITLGGQAKATAGMGEYLQYVLLELERQFHGRILILPALTYWSGHEPEQTLQSWIEEAKKANVKHVFTLTCDPYWRGKDVAGANEVIWLPASMSEHMDEEMRRKIVRDQVSTLIGVFTSVWFSME